MTNSIRQFIKEATGRNLWLRYFFLAGWRLFYSSLAAATGHNVSGERSDAEVEQYAGRTFKLYKTWAGVNHFYGRVAEVGPGNVNSIAKMFLADGCSQVDQIERFNYGANPAPDSSIRLYREPAEKFFLAHGGYDFIVSCAVMEHLYDPLSALRAMVPALKPDGTMVHWIDCRDHGQFSDKLHDLSFLRIPKSLYWPLTLASGLNRVRLSAYTSLLEPLGFECRILVTSLAGIPDLILPAQQFDYLDSTLLALSREHVSILKQKLAAPFRVMPERELMISQFVLIAKRRADSTTSS